MNAQLLHESTDYEKLTQVVYTELLRREGDSSTEVAHDKDVLGRSGVAHQVDVLWRFKKASVDHAVLVECKNYSRALTLEKVRSFFAVLQDVGNCSGIMVTKTGYQSGVAEFAKFYGISLKLLRKPTDDDWVGRVKNIGVCLIIKQLVSTPDKPVHVSFEFEASDEAQRERIENTVGRIVLTDPLVEFLDSVGRKTGETLESWLHQNIPVLDKDHGGPHQQRIEVQD